MGRFVCVLIFSFFVCRALGQEKRPIIAFTSDTQQPMPGETIIRKANHNQKATELIFNDVDKIRPSGFFILGDLVSFGYKNKSWAAVDTYIKQCLTDSIPVYATLGNHEVMLNTKLGTKNFKSRFPMYDPAGYMEIVDSVAVILLNSNFSKMTMAEILAQDNWYNNAIKNWTTIQRSDSLLLVVIILLIPTAGQ